ncbi:cell wall hydrolase [Sphingomonas changnyeongensis]|uniref:Cell wall hydrolase n=2 Tax=Sphingomonas changnyeongensis TaxID=2698679 RepID=A0A7Z2NVC1_9SPHN|nr:cell wall hydrolase [Sphingomonas changnyeongensis]
MSNAQRIAGLMAMTIATIFGIAGAPGLALPADQKVGPLTAQTLQGQSLQGQSVPADVTVSTDGIVPSLAVDASALQDSPSAAQPASLAEMVAAQPVPARLDRELECLAASVYFESKSEPLEGQLAVAEVVLNRANSGGRFPSSICGVVFQPSQFSFVRGNGFPPINRTSTAWETAVAIAQIAIAERWESRAADALFFHAAHVRPSWRKTRVATLGNHHFYR